MGWIGVDLDGTLAHYDKWNGVAHIGKPVPAMLTRVKSWLEEGQQVKIVTARVSEPEDAEMARVHIQEWCLAHLGQVLEVTHAKDIHMIELWDDRCVQIVSNTGQRADGRPV